MEVQMQISCGYKENETVYLMHKDTPLVLFIYKNGKLHINGFSDKAIAFIPIGCYNNGARLHEWLKDRAVPETRKGVSHALRELGFSNTYDYLLANLGLSLTDSYWLRPRSLNLSWRQVNLYNNAFVDIFGDLTFDTHRVLTEDQKVHSKFLRATSQGELQKKWYTSGNIQYLIKGNWGTSYQQSLNEVFASLIHKKQGFSRYTDYRVCHIKDTYDTDALGCMSQNFCSEQFESVSAYDILHLHRYLNKNSNWFYPFRDNCVELGIDINTFYAYMSYMIETDFVMSNTDRHMNNIALLRDSYTGIYTGFTPIYDTGNSMFFRDHNLPRVVPRLKTHSFTEKELDLLKCIPNEYRCIVDISKLPTKEEFMQIYSQDVLDRLPRLEALYSLYTQKIRLLHMFQNGKDIWKTRF
jgi:hypothetical protein